MSKLGKIKERLAALLVEVEFEMVKTDKAVLEYDGELAEGTSVFVVDGETEERIAAADGEYKTEDNKIITVADGKVVSIVEAEEEKEAEVVEEVVEETVEAEEAEVVEEPTEEEVTEEEPNEDKVAELETKIANLETKLTDLETRIEDYIANTQTILSKIEKMSVAKPVAEEFENVKTVKKTGNSKVDKFMEKYGNN